MIRLAIFASGRGSNAQQIIDHFHADSAVEVALIVTNKSTAGVLDIATQYDIATYIINKVNFSKSSVLLKELRTFKIDFIALAGFLWLIPEYLLHAFPNRIVNLHPALLPKYGGAGMYGRNVHLAVAKAQESQSGITIHYVNEHYDEGNIIFQASCSLMEEDNADTIARKVQRLEHQYFPTILDAIIHSPSHN